MKIKLVLLLMAVISTASWTTPGPHGLNLNGKMFTLSRNSGGISLYPPSWPSTPSYTTSPYYTNTPPYTKKHLYTTTKDPYTTSKHPYTTSKHPYTTTKDPYTTTKHPYTTTEHNSTTSKHPYTTTKDPYTTTEHNPTTSKHHYTNTKHPYTTTEHNPTTSKHPYTTTKDPYTTTEHNPTTSKHHFTNTKHPYTTTQHYSPKTRRSYTTTKRPYTPTTAPSTRGVSVCLRYLTDFLQTSYSGFFTVSPSSAPLQVDIDQFGICTLNFNSYSYNTLKLRPSIRFWSNIQPDIWNRVCLTVDSMKNVAQVFSDSNISIRKVMPYQYVWSGEPVIEFPGFDGQVTDVQMWDYPLSYREVFKYMTSSVYRPHRGSVLTWSSISYTPRGNTLLEDVYEWQAKQQISGRRRGRQPKGGRKNRKFVNVEEREEEIRDQLV